MGVSENLFGTQCIALTYARPFPIGVDGELMRDAYSGIVYRWSASTGNWIPWGATEQPVTFWIDPVAGNNLNSGAFATPFASLQTAIDRLPPEILHEIQIRFIDGGLPLVMDEQVNIANFYCKERIRIIGNTRIAVLLSGNNVLAPNPAYLGDYWTFTDPAGAWTPGDLIGKRANFTAGPRAGTTSFIIDNTATTITFGHRPGFFEGPYGPLDGFEIRENLDTLQRLTGLFELGSLRLSNVVGTGIGTPALSDAKGLWLEDFVVAGDNTLGLGVMCFGEVYMLGLRTSFRDGFLATNQGGTTLGIIQSLAWPTAGGSSWEWFVLIPQLPQSITDMVFVDSGLIGAIYCGDRNKFSLYNSNGREDPLVPIGHCISYVGASIHAADLGLDGMLISRPFTLESHAYGGIQLNQVDFRNSPTYGLGARDAELPHAFIDIDYGGGLPVSEFQNCGTYGIDASGIRLTFWGAAASTIPNGIAGVRLRRGAIMRVAGGILPTLSGPIPLLTEIDFDDQLIPFFTTYAVTAAGLTTLCAQFNP